MIDLIFLMHTLFLLGIRRNKVVSIYKKMEVIKIKVGN